MNRVPADGSPSSRITIIGEAPGADEDRLGKPFVGMSGQLLMQYLGRVNLVRSDVYLTNVVKERPARNDIGQFIQFNNKGRLIKKTEAFDAYVAELKEELSKCSSNVIVVCGNIPLWVLTGKHGISKWRGSILQSGTEFGNRKVIPVLHPAAILRKFGKTSGRFRHTYRMDWERIAEDAQFPELRLPQRTLHINNSYDAVMEYLHRCEAWPDLLGFDTESSRTKSTGWELSHIQFALGPSESMCISFIEVHNFDGVDTVVDTYTAKQEADIMALAASILESKKVRKVGQNLKYDNYFLFRKYGIVVQNWDDCRVAHRVAYPEMPASLGYFCSIYTREPFYKDDGKQHKVGKTLTTTFQEYAAKDAAVCCEIFPKIHSSLVKLKNVERYDHTVKAHYVTTYMMGRGIKMNKNGVRRLDTVYEQRLNIKYAELQAVCHTVQRAAGVEEFDVRPTSFPNARAKKNPLGDIGKYFYEVKGVPPYYRKRKSKDEPQMVTVNEECLKRLVRKGHQEARMILEYRRMRKARSTYIRVKQNAGRFCGEIDPVGTRQARFSGKKNSFGEGTNPQNLPYWFRKVLCADPGYLLVEIDLSQAENRTVARIGDVKAVLDAFANGVDVHSLTAASIFNKPVKEVSKVKGSCPIGDGKLSERDWGKKANHAFNYAFGEDSFSLKYEIDINDARKIRNGWLAANKGITNYWRWVEHEINTRRMLTNSFGRTIFFMSTVGKDLYRVAYSCIPQTNVADDILDRGICFFYDNSHIFHGFEPLNQVHDALWFQVRMDLGPQYLVNCLRMMKTEYEKPIPWKDTSYVIPADFKVGKAFGRLVDFNPAKPDAVEKLTQMYWS